MKNEKNDSQFNAESEQPAQQSENPVNEQPKTAGQKAKEFFFWILPYICAVILVILLKSFIFILATIPSTSMVHTLEENDKVYGNRLAYINHEPQRGDIIIFKAPDTPDELFIKRLIGLPGDKVVIDNAKIYINDSEVPLTEDYLPEEWFRKATGFEYHVPDGCYFMLGDNRNYSNDARSWTNTFVTRDAIVARAEFIYWPLNRIADLHK